MDVALVHKKTIKGGGIKKLTFSHLKTGTLKILPRQSGYDILRQKNALSKEQLTFFEISLPAARSSIDLKVALAHEEPSRSSCIIHQEARNIALGEQRQNSISAFGR